MHSSSSQKRSKGELIAARSKTTPDALKLFFPIEPLHIEKARGQYLYDEDGHKYLDCISNVQHVGHCHPAVVEAASIQMAKTNCNSRFIHTHMNECAQALCDTVPYTPLNCVFCNSGSESNDLALRMARDFTGGTEILVLDHAYHGHLTSMIDISPYKFNGKGGKGKPSHVHVVPVPDAYRGKHRLPDEKLNDFQAQIGIADEYVKEVEMICKGIELKGLKLAAFYMESLVSCGGQIIPPPTYLRKVIEIVHKAGGIVIVDEVQSGFGRVGKCFWAFQIHNDLQGSCPDIISMGKPMGNGFPVSAIVVKKHIANTFGKGMEYFNTFGGNPVACAVVLAVLKVMQDEHLQRNAQEVGEYLLNKLEKLKGKHLNIGQVRGVGLFIGIDLVQSRVSREPQTELATSLINLVKRKYLILLSAEGPYGNIIKFKPPMCFDKNNADQLVKAIDEALIELVPNKARL